MTQAETRALGRAAGILLAASVLRLAWEMRPIDPVVPAGRENVLPQLLASSDSIRIESERRGTPLAPGEKLDPNRASDVELDRIPGVGPSTARAIVDTREKGTVFRAPEDLFRVRGIGEVTLDRMRPHLDLPGETPGTGSRRRVRSGSGSGARTGTGVASVDLNRAGLEALEALPGIGPALAERIVQFRAERGRFRSVEELMEVRGIGEATLERLRPYLRVGS